MTVGLSLLGGAGAQFFDNSGDPLVGGKLYTYAAGTTTPQATYTTNIGNIPHSNPIILDAAGRVPAGGEIWLSDGLNYKFVVTTSADVLIGTYDNISGNGSGILSSLAAPTGSSLVGFIQSGTGAVARTVLSKLRDAVSVTDFGATGDGVTDDRPAIQEAVDYLQSIGGGTLLFPPGTYLLVTWSATAGGLAGAHVSMTNYTNISFVGYGALLKSTQEYYGAIFFMDGCRNMSFEGFNCETPFVRTPGSATITTNGSYPFICLSETRDSNNISIKNMRAANVYGFCRCSTTDPTSIYRVRGLSIDNVLTINAYYGLNFSDNGDLVNVRDFRLVNGIRTYFPYGVANHDIQYTSTNNDYFTDCLIKAYSRDTHDIRVKCTIVGNTSVDAHCTIESQHDPVAQPIPAKLYNIFVDYDDLQSPATPTKSLRFAYFRNATETATSANNLFDNVTFRGTALKKIDFAVAVPADSCLLNIDNLTYDIPNTIRFWLQGFYSRYGQSNFIRSDGVTVRNNYGVYNYTSTYFGNFAESAVYGYADGTTGLSVCRISGETAYPLELTRFNANTANDLICTIKGKGIGPGAIFYEGGNTGAPNAANAVMKIGQMDVTARSINAAGTINASGTDYAEYENNNGLSIAKGAIVGFKADGSLTLTFAEATRFGVKSTNPSYVGGDTWGSDEQPPERIVRVMNEVEEGVVTVVGDTDEEWQAKEDAYSQELAAFETRLEAKRQLVDRIAYSGKAPVNVTGANAGEYIIAVENIDGSIGGSAVANPTFEEYKLAVGRVNRILDDGRAEIAVIIH